MDDCDLWERGTRGGGYGALHIGVIDGKKTRISTHRLVWMQDNGHTDLHILHSCDTPACINIDHLRAGTNQDNVDDREERGRGRTNGNEYKTHCSHGHEYTEENTYQKQTQKGRLCKTCIKRRNDNRRRK